MTDSKDIQPTMDSKVPNSTQSVESKDNAKQKFASSSLSKRKGFNSYLPWILWALILIAILSSISLWQKLNRIQSQLAKQNQEAIDTSKEAKLLARTANEMSQQAVAKQALLDAKITELTSQKAQIDELMQTVSRSRVESLVIDIESSLNLAQQQSALTGSVEPIVVTLQTAQQRIARSPSPRLAGLQAAMRRDLDKAIAINTLDTPNLLVKLDDAIKLVQEMPLVTSSLDPLHTKSGQANSSSNKTSAFSQDAKTKSQAKTAKASASSALKMDVAPAWYEFDWSSAWLQIKNQLNSLVRISPIDYPEAALLSPDQAFFVRENLKLHLLNVRMAILSRQFNLASADLNRSLELTNRYFDANSKQTQVCSSLLLQINSQLKVGKLPTVTDSLNATSALLGSK